jgi:hypothetical protein
LTQSSKESVDPNLKLLVSDKLEPIRAKDLIESALPIELKSKADMADPSRAKLRTEMLEPQNVYDNTESRAMEPI